VNAGSIQIYPCFPRGKEYSGEYSSVKFHSMRTLLSGLVQKLDKSEGEEVKRFANFICALPGLPDDFHYLCRQL